MSAGHVAPKSLYYLIFAALLIGTALTVAVAFVDLGAMNNVAMLTIAAGKALLVILFFMHVRWGTRLTWPGCRVRILLAADPLHHHHVGLPDPRMDRRIAAITQSVR